MAVRRGHILAVEFHNYALLVSNLAYFVAIIYASKQNEDRWSLFFIDLISPL